MKVYGLISFLCLFLIFLYTIGFAWQLWKEEKNKMGSIFVSIIALLIIIIPFYFFRH
ncbi:hypothetical protein DFR56_10257 [Pseudogracilibacillus auburnensis]|uniref:Uncharacterized protein n=1 Tax=Pseudogracilibacillus auburnensis TaxID=1494959 RepID=A0A2V3W8H5_9BACI|nr:hypothetical protein DFR56_10257 [Pseudogracilibacillus auburnensis]